MGDTHEMMRHAKRLELTIENLNQKLTKLKQEALKLKEDNVSLKASNENHIYINEKLNKALQKFMMEKTTRRNKDRKQKEKKDADFESIIKHD